MNASKKTIRIGIFVDGDFIPSYDGAANRFHYLARHLGLHSQVDVVIFHGYRRWSDVTQIVAEPFTTYFIPIQKYYSDLDFLATLVREEKLDILQFDNLEPLLMIGISLAKQTGCHLVSDMLYDVVRLASSLGAPIKKIAQIKKMEASVTRNIDGMICISDIDLRSIRVRNNVKRDKLFLLSSGVDTAGIKFIGANIESKTLLFLGNLFFEPNAVALNLIVEKIYPRLKSDGYSISVVGDVPAGLLKKYANEVDFVGTVADLNSVLKKATVALAPILEGTGLRIKILNYLAAGLPTLTTSFGAEGFARKELLVIEDRIENYAAVIKQLVSDKSLLKRKATLARKIMEKEYDWSVIAANARHIYLQILEKTTCCKNIWPSEKPSEIQPVWLDEAIQKKRFNEIPSSIPINFSYAVSKNGTLKVF